MKKIGYIDVHCHLTNEKEYAAAGGTEAVIAAAKNAGADTLIVSGFDEASSKAAAELSARHDGVYFCAGLQPEEIKPFETNEAGYTRALETGARAAEREKVRGAGRNRTGLPLRR